MNLKNTINLNLKIRLNLKNTINLNLKIRLTCTRGISKCLLVSFTNNRPLRQFHAIAPTWSPTQSERYRGMFNIHNQVDTSRQDSRINTLSEEWNVVPHVQSSLILFPDLTYFVTVKIRLVIYFVTCIPFVVCPPT